MNLIKKYTKKPVEVSVILFDESPESKNAILRILPNTVFDKYGFMIPTLEGSMRARVGDYIVIGVDGEVYACKPDIFKKTYDPVDKGN